MSSAQLPEPGLTPVYRLEATLGRHWISARDGAITRGAPRQRRVTARDSNQLLAFSAKKLHADPRHPLVMAVRVGEAPIGLALVGRGREIVIADSNRFDTPGAAADPDRRPYRCRCRDDSGHFRAGGFELRARPSAARPLATVAGDSVGAACGRHR
jgi:hypothetical protein